ncbi:MAG: DUF4097 family beta strand repeat protein [Clostridia bacterium]|nr:DUF4097 family beta strand repeat protein [Clostridia bacterium]
MIDRDDPKVQKWIKYGAIALAVCLSVSIIGGIIGAIGSVFGLFLNDETLDETKTYEISGDITELDIEISAADFTVEYGDAFRVESNLRRLEVEEKGATLVIEDEKKLFGGNYNDATLTLTVPEGVAFERIEITTGAGRVRIEELIAEELELTLGAGEVTIESLTATRQASIEGGAGQVTINGGSLSDLDFDMGVGKVTLTGALVGTASLDVGIGEFNLNLIGSSEIYSLGLNKGIGSIRVGGGDVDGGATLGTGENKVTVNGGIGAVNVEFSE